jgi:hypothetical protein
MQDTDVSISKLSFPNMGGTAVSRDTHRPVSIGLHR